MANYKQSLRHNFPQVCPSVPEELNEQLNKSDTFRRQYIYSVGAIGDAWRYLHNNENEYEKFIGALHSGELTTSTGIGYRIIADQDNNYGHSGASAFLTLKFLAVMITHGLEPIIG